MKFSEFRVPFDWSALAKDFADIDVVVVGRSTHDTSSTTPLEERERGVLDIIERIKIRVVVITPVETPSVENRITKGHYAVSSGEDSPTEYVRWNELTDWVEKNWLGKHVLMDLTTLSGGGLFQLYAAIHACPSVQMSAMYLVPEVYPQVRIDDDNDLGLLPVVTRVIKQPHGYSSFANEYVRGRRRHFIFLGFDRHRPNKFVEHYQWPIAEVHALLGVPAFVEHGDEQACKSLGPLHAQLDSLCQIHPINPKFPMTVGDVVGVCEHLLALTADAEVIDIVPLGPKPTLLGCLIFYWQGLDETKREKVRFLYDFPTTRKQRTEGLRQLWLYKNIQLPQR